MNYQLLIEKAKQAGIQEIEVYAQKHEGLEINIFKRRVEKNVLSKTEGLAVRGIYQGKMGYVSLENTGDDQIEFIINTIKENASLIGTTDEDVIYKGSAHYETLPAVDTSIKDVSPKVKIDLLLELENKLLSMDPRITDVDHCSYQEFINTTAIFNSQGLNLEKVESYALIYASVVAKEDQEVKNHGDYIIIKSLDDLSLEDFTKEIVSKAISKLHAEPVASKQYPVIIENRNFANLMMSFASMFSGESAVRNMTPLKDKLGQKIFGDNVNLINDPLYSGAISKCAFDDEGVACRKIDLVSNGVLNTLAHNLKTAKQLGTESTGNGFKMGLKAPVSVRPYNLYLAPGQVSFDEMVASMEEGLIIDSFQGLHSGVNPVNGDFSLQASGYLVINGKLARPVNLIVVSGNFLELLNQIEMLGNDLRFTYNRIGAPSIKVNLSVSGK